MAGQFREMPSSKSDLYRSIASFLQTEVESGGYTSEITESLEVAKQCLESAFNLPAETNRSIPDLLALFNAASKDAKSSSQPEPTEETKTMAETLKNQGNLCMKEGQYEEAIACYTKAIELSPHNAVYFCNRAAAHSRLEQQDKAIEDCQSALKIDPKYSKAYGRMGIAYSSLGDYSKAAEAYRKALELDPTNENCQQNLALAEERLRESGIGSAAGGGLDIGAILNNPMMQNIACQLMRDPNTQNAMADLFRSTFGAASGGGGGGAVPTTASTNAANSTSDTDTAQNGPSGGPPNVDQFLRLGQQLAQQLRAANPQLVDQLRQTFQNTSSDPATGPTQ